MECLGDIERTKEIISLQEDRIHLKDSTISLFKAKILNLDTLNQIQIERTNRLTQQLKICKKTSMIKYLTGGVVGAGVIILSNSLQRK